MHLNHVVNGAKNLKKIVGMKNNSFNIIQLPCMYKGTNKSFTFNIICESCVHYKFKQVYKHNSIRLELNCLYVN